MASRVLLDTSAYAQFRRGQSVVVDILASAERAFLSAVTLGELSAGFILGSRLEENRAALRDFLAEPFVGVVSIDEEVSQLYAEAFVALRRAGTPIPINDVWIAACARKVGAELVTFDADFRRIAGLNARVLAV